MSTTFKVTEAFYPAIYDGFPNPFDRARPVQFGLAINADELPADLLPWAKPAREKHGHMVISIYGNIAPVVICSGHDTLNTTLLCARNANLRVNELFTGIPVEIAVRTFEIEQYRNTVGPSRSMNVVAIQVDGDDLIRRYNELCAQYFTGG